MADVQWRALNTLLKYDTQCERDTWRGRRERGAEATEEDGICKQADSLPSPILLVFAHSVTAGGEYLRLLYMQLTGRASVPARTAVAASLPGTRRRQRAASRGMRGRLQRAELEQQPQRRRARRRRRDGARGAAAAPRRRPAGGGPRRVARQGGA